MVYFLPMITELPYGFKDSGEIALCVNEGCACNGVNQLGGAVAGKNAFQFSNGHAFSKLLDSDEVVEDSNGGAGFSHVVAVVVVVKPLGSEYTLRVCEISSKAVFTSEVRQQPQPWAGTDTIDESPDDCIAIKDNKSNGKALCSVSSPFNLANLQVSRKTLVVNKPSTSTATSKKLKYFFIVDPFCTFSSGMSGINMFIRDNYITLPQGCQ